MPNLFTVAFTWDFLNSFLLDKIFWKFQGEMVQPVFQMLALLWLILQTTVHIAPCWFVNSDLACLAWFLVAFLSPVRTSMSGCYLPYISFRLKYSVIELLGFSLQGPILNLFSNQSEAQKLIFFILCLRSGPDFAQFTTRRSCYYLMPLLSLVSTNRPKDRNKIHQPRHPSPAEELRTLHVP